MAENLIVTQVPEKKSVKKNSFYVVDETADTKRIEDVNNLLNDALNTEKLEKTPEKAEKKADKTQNLDDGNPFFGDKDSLIKLKKYGDYEIVEEEKVVHKKNQISPKAITRTENKSKQKKLWQITGGIVLALFIALFGYNMFSINSIAKKVVTTQYDITQLEQTLQENNDSYEQILEDAKITSGMSEANTGGQTIDLSPKSTKNEYEIKTSLWDKVCNFFAKIFGR
ncbi:MAG: hypothetical protein IJ837_04050 [Clostridia bacterium]|nr:hypothetical protein [Clostridia bacterium]